MEIILDSKKVENIEAMKKELESSLVMADDCIQ